MERADETATRRAACFIMDLILKHKIEEGNHLLCMGNRHFSSWTSVAPVCEITAKHGTQFAYLMWAYHQRNHNPFEYKFNPCSGKTYQEIKTTALSERNHGKTLQGTAEFNLHKFQVIESCSIIDNFNL